MNLAALERGPVYNCTVSDSYILAVGTLPSDAFGLSSSLNGKLKPNVSSSMGGYGLEEIAFQQNSPISHN